MKLINMKLPDKAEKIMESLMAAGYEAYAVGGCVRDSILGRTPGDWDITTSARPEEVMKIFDRTIETGIQHGTVTVMIDHEGFEVTTYRIDGEYEDGRHPKEVAFTRSLTEDLKRRDFTINAMAYNKEQGIVDIFGGQEDLKRKIIRCVGNPEERFCEDALRMMRAVRFAAQLGFTLDEKTKAAIQKLSKSLQKVSAERIQVELVKLICSNEPEHLITAYETGLTSVFFPEFDAMMKTEQNTPYHKYSVGGHTICAMQNIEADKVLRLTMMLHDIGKPVCKTTDEKGIDHFKCHDVKGEQIALDRLRALKFDNDTLKSVKQLVRWHDYRFPAVEKSVRKAVYRIGKDLFPMFLKVRRADIMAQSEKYRQENLLNIEEIETIFDKILEEKQCLSVKELEINGKDLLRLGVPQGKQIGQILKELMEIVMEEPEKNNRKFLEEYVKSKV